MKIIILLENKLNLFSTVWIDLDLDFDLDRDFDRDHDHHFLQDSEAGQLYGLEKFWAFMKYYPHAEVVLFFKGFDQFHLNWKF